jgi:hypothetical protein
MGHVALPDQDPAVGHLLQTRKHPQAGRLAAPRRPTSTNELAVAGLKVLCHPYLMSMILCPVRSLRQPESTVGAARMVTE